MAVCTVREELSRVVKRLKDKNAIKKFGGECECVGDANHPGCCKSMASSTGVGRGFGFVPMLRVYITAVTSGAYSVCYAITDYFKTGINGQRVGGCWRSL